MAKSRTHQVPGERGFLASREQWSSTRCFVMAASGAVIGFNNFWQFPALLHQHGGGAFLILYLFWLAVLGLPLLAAALMLGRRARLSPISGMHWLAAHTRSDPNWTAVGWVATVSAFLIVSYLCVVAGWTLAFVPRAAFGVFGGVTADGIASLFTTLVRDPEKQLFWFTLFVALTATVVGRGVRPGIERLARVAMPLVFALLAALALYAAIMPPFLDTLARVLTPNFSVLSVTSVLAAMTQAFFSLGLGAGIMMMYGAHMSDDVAIPRVTLAIAGFDLLASLLAAVIFPTLLAAGAVELASGPALVFQALPLALDHLPLGAFVTPLLYLMLVAAAWLSACALFEPVVVWLRERFSTTRARAALGAGMALWVVGLAMMLSFSHWAFAFRFFGQIKTLGIFDVTQIVTTHVLLPLTGIAMALFAGWRLRAEESRAQLGFRSPCSFDAWLWLMRIVVPALGVIMIFTLPGVLA